MTIHYQLKHQSSFLTSAFETVDQFLESLSFRTDVYRQLGKKKVQKSDFVFLEVYHA